MVTPELKWPTTKLTPSPTNLLATETPCLGSETSSPIELDLLAENAASLVDVLDRLSDAVRQLRAERGVRAGDRAGDANLICASAVPAKPRPAASTRPVNQYFFILRSLCLGRRQRPEAETIPP